MNAAEHAAEAERLLDGLDGWPLGSPERASVATEAQVHATLATVVPYVTFDTELGEALTVDSLAGSVEAAEVGAFPSGDFEALLAAARHYLDQPSEDTESLDLLIAAVDRFGPRQHSEAARG